MLKKLLSVVLAGTLVFVMVVCTLATDNDIPIYVNGQYIDSGIIINNRTLASVRAIFEALGAEVQWKEVYYDGVLYRNDVITTKGDIEIIFTIGASSMLITNENYLIYGYKDLQYDEIALGVPVQLVNGRTLVPVREVAEILGAKVNWNGYTNTVEIYDTYSYSEEQAKSFLREVLYREWGMLMSDENELLISEATKSNKKHNGDSIYFFKFSIYRVTSGRVLVFADGEVIYDHDIQFGDYKDYFDFDIYSDT